MAIWEACVSRIIAEDYVVAKGHDPVALEHRMWSLLDQRGAQYPDEHNVGHLYPAGPKIAAFYRTLDPCNQFNPGIDLTSKLAGWRDPPAAS